MEMKDTRSENQNFEIGKAICIKDGKGVSIFATGHLVWEAMEAQKALEEQGISARNY